MPPVRFKDYYQTLGLGRDADEKAIRAAYRKHARANHPDLHPGDKVAEERFKDVNEAHEVLSDPAKRKMYDRYGEEWQRYRDAGFTGNEPAGGRTTFDPNDFGAWFSGERTASTGRSSGSREGGSFRVDLGGQGGDGPGFSDFFQTIFGNARGGRSSTATAPRRRRGEDSEVGIEIDFAEAFHGATRTFEVQSLETCPRCHGTGLAREAVCPTCDGTGQAPKTKAIEVRIPAGVATGSRIRVAGQGAAGDQGGANGDVYLRVTVRPDRRFEREGDDLRTEVEVSLFDALLGGETVVPTPTGRVALTIPPGTQPGRVFRLRKLGMPKLKGPQGERGDLLVRVRVALPVELSARERALVEELRALRSGAESGPSGNQ
ncbi:MAG: Chaperone protein DnaJ [uncultured Thermomicrobiales bacterium]|uniref:Chaperone protein DnaJ n=1 Tax=uncultured Thermomicrobiales bacterium TaxID=1645740 RepID=A0A6J4UV39_9BACT|nr:MAG: Chaperone protein DnaJ [uncultured Thermomicrobiales bacterium]